MLAWGTTQHAPRREDFKCPYTLSPGVRFLPLCVFLTLGSLVLQEASCHIMRDTQAVLTWIWARKWGVLSIALLAVDPPAQLTFSPWYPDNSFKGDCESQNQPTHSQIPHLETVTHYILHALKCCEGKEAACLCLTTVLLRLTGFIYFFHVIPISIQQKQCSMEYTLRTLRLELLEWRTYHLTSMSWPTVLVSFLCQLGVI